MRDRHAFISCLPENRRVVRSEVDWVGNDLTTVLRWCETHLEPVWVYGDESYECPYDMITRVEHEHVLVLPPWEEIPNDA